jgi:predicted nucleic acid-binding protein
VRVLDASAALEWLLQTPTGQQIERRFLRWNEQLCAPHLLDLEVAQILRRYERMGELTAERAQRLLDEFQGLLLIRYEHDLFLPRIWELRHNVTAYDAAYLALAEAIPAPLITCDSRLARASGHDAVVEVV